MLTSVCRSSLQSSGYHLLPPIASTTNRGKGRFRRVFSCSFNSLWQCSIRVALGLAGEGDPTCPLMMTLISMRSERLGGSGRLMNTYTPVIAASGTALDKPQISPWLLICRITCGNESRVLTPKELEDAGRHAEPFSAADFRHGSCDG